MMINNTGMETDSMVSETLPLSLTAKESASPTSSVDGLQYLQ